MTGMNENPLDLLPELIVLAGLVAGLLTGSFLPRTGQRAVAWICATALAAAMGATVQVVTRPDMTAFESFAIDLPTNVTRFTVGGATLFVLVMAERWARGDRRETEVYVLLLLAALGSILLAAADDLLVFVAAYLLASIPAYALTAFAKDASGTEAALKYYLMGAFLGVIMLGGVTLLYGLTGTTFYETVRTSSPGAAGIAVLLVLAGVFFKIGAVPAHFWVPDAAQGASPVVAAFVTTVPKVGAFVALFRMATEMFDDSDLVWRPLIAAIAVATMTLGNLAAFYQDNVRRLLAYSTISQAGYLLLPIVVTGRTDLAGPALLFYVAAYAITNLGAFAVVVAAGRDTLADYTGLARRSPLLALALVICLLGLVGTPPTAVFVGKLLVFAAAWDGGYAWLAVVAVINTVASVFYYLRWIVPVFRTDGLTARRPHRRGIAYLAAVLSLLLGIAGGLVLAIG